MMNPVQDLHAVAVELQRSALAAVEPGAAVRQHLRRQGDTVYVGDRSYDVGEYEHVYVVGGGKAAVAMASAVVDVLGDRLTRGLVVTKYGHAVPGPPLPNLNVLEAGHPVPDKNSVRGARAIADLYQIEPLLGEAATESAVSGGASQAEILHLAAHGSYNPHTPLYSAIALAPDGEGDGRLEVREIYGLDLTNADLVVLSACQTQLGELSAGDELVGLTRAFFFAGTPTVCRNGSTLPAVTPGTSASVSSRTAICRPSSAEASRALRLWGRGTRGQSRRMPSAFSARYAGL